MFRKRKTKTDKEIAEEMKEYDDYLERLKKLTPTEFKPSIKIKEITLEVNKVVPFDDNHSLRLRKDGCIEVIERIR